MAQRKDRKGKSRKATRKDTTTRMKTEDEGRGMQESR